jgi:hypothetical protein
MGEGIRKRRLSVGVRLSEKPLRLDSLPIGEAARRQIGHTG